MILRYSLTLRVVISLVELFDAHELFRDVLWLRHQVSVDLDAGLDLLLEVFLSEGKKAGLDPDFLATVFDFLNDQRFISEGRRGHVRAELARLIKEHAEGA